MRPVEPDTPTVDPLSKGLAHLGANEPDHAQAVHWFRVAADAGSAEGLALLAVCQLEGLGLPRDPAQARTRLEAAAAQGSLTGKFHLGRMLVAGWGGAPDAARGVALYTAAAAQGHADATFNLAACLDGGWGCNPDRLAAKALFLRARTLGSPLRAPGVRIRERELDAVRELARRFESGEGLTHLIEERQHEMALVQEVVRQNRHTKRRSAQHQQRLARLTGIAAAVGSVAGAVAGLFGWHGKRPMQADAGPTSVA
ncbi:MAG: sel1 repeat family protein [Rubrivivax sp.]|nr:MAG: sel1 repeat family protein [Rubrivivax sp.]